MPTFPEHIDLSLQDSYARNIYIFDIYDGDTVYFHADLGYGQWAMFQTGRLLDVQAPEWRPLKSRGHAQQAKAYLWELIRQHALNREGSGAASSLLKFGSQLQGRTQQVDNKWFSDLPVTQKGKYGRWLLTLVGADAHGLPVNINELLLHSGYARPYSSSDIAALGFSQVEIQQMSL